jgi:phosphoribosylformimino-5-aminoimidazole carboxamide ribotide isomerase
MSSFELYPAIDVRGGRVVRLAKGDYAAETVYGDDPIAVAAGFADEGATWVHVVDLDAARTGEAVNRDVVGRIASALAGRCRVQTGGGVRSPADVEALAAAGVTRVVMGSAAVRDPELVRAASTILPVAVGLDHRGGELAVHGWTARSGVQLVDALRSFPSAAAFVVTDISRDGMLAGPDVEGLSQVAVESPVPVIASGGVASLGDLAALAHVPGLGGAITGKALYEGRFTVAEALAALDSSRKPA